MAQVHTLNGFSSSEHPLREGTTGPRGTADLEPAPVHPSEGRWRMLAWFGGAALVTGAALAVLGLIADPAGVRYGLAPVWGPAYMTYPVTVNLG